MPGWLFFFFLARRYPQQTLGAEKKPRDKKLGTIKVFSLFLLVIITGVRDMLHVVIIMYNEFFSSVYLLLPASLYDKQVGTGIAQRISYNQL